MINPQFLLLKKEKVLLQEDVQRSLELVDCFLTQICLFWYFLSLNTTNKVDIRNQVAGNSTIFGGRGKPVFFSAAISLASLDIVTLWEEGDTCP